MPGAARAGWVCRGSTPPRLRRRRRARRTTTDSKSWRLKLYKAGLAAILVDLAVYLCGIVTVSSLVDHPAAQIRAGDWFFLIGSCVAIIAAILTLFGYRSEEHTS